MKEQRSYMGRRGFTLLELLLQPIMDEWNVPWIMTQRDAEVAACVIQWLGTNNGGCFVDRCKQIIEKLRAERNDKLYRTTIVEARRQRREAAKIRADEESALEQRAIIEEVEQVRSLWKSVLDDTRAEADRALQAARLEHERLLEEERARTRMATEQLAATRAQLSELTERTRAIDLE